MDTPQGSMPVRFVRVNEFGLLDHDVSPAQGAEVFVPIRVVPNGQGSEVLLTLFQPSGMPDERYAEDRTRVESGLNTLKAVMERRPQEPVAASS